MTNETKTLPDTITLTGKEALMCRTLLAMGGLSVLASIVKPDVPYEVVEAGKSILDEYQQLTEMLSAKLDGSEAVAEASMADVIKAMKKD